MEHIISEEISDAKVVYGAKTHDAQMLAEGVYDVECFDKDGNLKWAELGVKNVVTNEGKNGMLDTYFAGSSYTGTWYMSLITNGSATLSSTYAVPIVTEISSGIVTSDTRPTISWSAASGGAKSATTTSFSITGTATITGNMVVTGGSGITTVGNTAATGGILFSAATFGSSKSVSSGDTLQVTYSISV